MPSRFYIDSSAYLGLLLGQPNARALEAELAGGIFLSSSLLVLEAKRNLVRLSRQDASAANRYEAALQRMRQDMQGFVLRDLTLDLCDEEVYPTASTPRSLDLAHLRTALWFHAVEPLTRFVSLDTRQTFAAQELGLPIDPKPLPH